MEWTSLGKCETDTSSKVQMKRFVCFPVQTEILIFSYRVSIRWNNSNFLNLVYQPSIILVSKKKRNKTEKNGFEHKKNNQQMFFFL